MSISKLARRMTLQIKPHTFDPLEPISIIDFLKICKLFCDTSEVHKGAAMWPSHVSMNSNASAVLIARLSADGTDKKCSRSASGNPRYFTTYSEVVQFLRKKFTADRSNTKNKSDIKHFAQPSHITLPQYAEELVTKILCCEGVYEKYALK